MAACAAEQARLAAADEDDVEDEDDAIAESELLRSLNAPASGSHGDAGGGSGSDGGGGGGGSSGGSDGGGRATVAARVDKTAGLVVPMKVAMVGRCRLTLSNPS